MHESAWWVGSYLLEDEKCHAIEIHLPGKDKPFVVPYPYRESPFG